MKAKELLKPRYEVIAEYPGCKWKIGDIIQCADKIEDVDDIGGLLRKYKYNFDKYPHLFKKLNWCKGFCGMNYCEENGCVEQKNIISEPKLSENGM